jgi:hypothetical protein
MRKLPQIGNAVAYTRDFIANVPDRSDWRGKILRACDFATADWPVVEVKWTRGPAKGETSNVNARNLCGVKMRTRPASAPSSSRKPRPKRP